MSGRHERGGETAAGAVMLSHIVGLGQSNEQGAQSEPVVSGADLGFSALMFDRGVQTRSLSDAPANPEMRDPSDFLVKPLTAAAQAIWVGETPAMGMIGQLTKAVQKAIGAETARRHFLYTFPHAGGKHLAELDWRDYETDPTNPNPGPGGYHATFVDDIKRARATALATGFAYEVAAFHLTQGENEGLGYLLPGGPLLGHGLFVPAYKADLAAAYARWDADARAVTMQDRAIPLFISQVDNYWAGQSQAKLADEGPDVFVVGPIYYVPSALNSLWNGTERGHRAHLSADGQRWRGEQAGKVMARVLLEGEEWVPLQPRSVRRLSPTSLVLCFDVPRPPIAFETDWLPKAPDYGFEVFLGTQDVPGPKLCIAEVTITGSREITIILDPATPLSESVPGFVTYGQALTIGVTPSVVVAIRAGISYEHGAEATEIVFLGDIRTAFAPLLVQGCFILRQIVKPDPAATGAAFGGVVVGGEVRSASMVVRDVRLEGNATIVRGETRSIDDSLVVGVACSIERDRPFGNLRDSDPAASNFTFADPTYGLRHGQMYPLPNFCLVFTAAIEG